MDYFSVSNKLALALVMPFDSSEFQGAVNNALNSYAELRKKPCELSRGQCAAVEQLYDELQEKVKAAQEELKRRKEA